MTTITSISLSTTRKSEVPITMFIMFATTLFRQRLSYFETILFTIVIVIVISVNVISKMGFGFGSESVEITDEDLLDCKF